MVRLTAEVLLALGAPARALTQGRGGFVAVVALLPVAFLFTLALPGGASPAATFPGASPFEGIVVEAERGVPVAGASVYHVDRAGRRIQGTFSDASGRFQLRTTPGEGERIEVERLGFAPLAVDFPLAPGVEDAPLVLRLTVRPLLLEGIQVGSDEPCAADPADEPRVAALWEVVRTGLRASEMSEAEGLVRFRAETWTQRELLLGGRVVPDRKADTLVVTGRPFHTVPPAVLAAEGYVIRDGSERTARGPDASSFLSSRFLETHCFQVAPPSRAARGLVGLAFEPVGARAIVDLAGVFWMEATTGELARVEFRYMEYGDEGWEPLAGESGGWTSFRTLAHGPRVVDAWELRLFTRYARPGRPMHDEAGGRLLELLEGPSR